MIQMLLYSVFFFKQKTAYEMRISDWSSDVCSSDLLIPVIGGVVLIGAGAGGGYFAASSGMLGGGAPKPAHDGPQRVERPAGETPHQVDSDGDGQCETSYFELKKEFTSNLYRKSVGSGKSVSVQVGLGGRWTIKKKKK